MTASGIAVDNTQSRITQVKYGLYSGYSIVHLRMLLSPWGYEIMTGCNTVRARVKINMLFFVALVSQSHRSRQQSSVNTA